jgi:hypothetical protein
MPIAFSMFDATTDDSENLLKISYSGRIAAEEARQFAEAVRGLLPRLQPGFRMLTDMQGLETMDLECVPYIEQVMDWCDEAGVKMIARIIPDPHKDIGLNIMSLFHYRRGVRIVTCQNLEEAKAALERAALGSK